MWRQFKSSWKYLTRLVEAADICRCAHRGGSSFQDGQPDTSHLRYLQLITFLTFYKIHKPLLGRTDTTSKSQEIEFSGVEFVEFNQVVKYLSGGEGVGGTICQDNKVLPYHVSLPKVA